jgi:hypothetical protein
MNCQKNTVTLSMMLTILKFFLHRRSQLRAEMPGCLLFNLSIWQSMWAYATQGYARACMIYGLPDSLPGM